MDGPMSDGDRTTVLAVTRCERFGASRRSRWIMRQSDSHLSRMARRLSTHNGCAKDGGVVYGLWSAVRLWFSDPG